MNYAIRRRRRRRRRRPPQPGENSSTYVRHTSRAHSKSQVAQNNVVQLQHTWLRFGKRCIFLEQESRELKHLLVELYWLHDLSKDYNYNTQLKGEE